MSELEVQAIKIEVGARYLLVIQGSQDALEELARYDRPQKMSENMKEWLAGDEPFLLIGLSDEFQVKLEKVEE